jgi:hypothetical protein
VARRERRRRRAAAAVAVPAPGERGKESDEERGGEEAGSFFFLAGFRRRRRLSRGRHSRSIGAARSDLVRPMEDPTVEVIWDDVAGFAIREGPAAY